MRLVLSVANELTQLFITLLFGNQPALATNPCADVQRFITEFEQEYGNSHPRFLTCSYGDALDEAKRDFKFLLVYSHSRPS